jgi:predicted RNA-binding protein associated with RNAse of E/G family
LTLDIVVRPDHSWYWKDVDELERAVSAGACSHEMAASIRRAGQDAAELVEARQSPFDNEWTSWRPPTGWQIDKIPDGWQHAPALITD